MKQILLVILAAAACNTSTPTGPADAADAGCTASASGNFVESTTTSANCPTTMAGAGATQGDTLLAFTIPSHVLDAPFTISIDLGATPTRGLYTSSTTALWSATGTRSIAPAGACILLAGNNTTPSGSFSLDLAAPDRGSLSVVMSVLPRVQDDGTETDCGPGTTETLDIQF